MAATTRCDGFSAMSEMSSNKPAKLKMVFFDMDGTLTDENSFPWLYDFVNIDAQNNKLWEEYKAGKVGSYREVLEPLGRAMKEKGMKKTDVRSVFSSVSITSGLAKVVKDFQDKGVKCVVVTCGAEELLARISNEIAQKNGRGFDDAMYLESHYDSNGVFSHFIPQVEYTNKGAAVKALQKKYKARPDECIAIGDTFGDLAMFEQCSYGILYNSSMEERLKVMSRCKNLSKIVILNKPRFADIPKLVLYHSDRI